MTRLALVTGASSGLGRALALELARRDHEIILLARDAGRLGSTREEIAQAGGRAEVVIADVMDEAALRAGVERSLHDRPLALLVHAAGILELGSLADLEAATLRRMLEVNVVGSANVVRAALPRLAAAQGHVALVSSVAGLFALPGGFTGYAASKWALRGWAETARPELHARGVSLTMCYPSILDTPMVGTLGVTAPDVYRAFPWHAPDRAARALVAAILSRRREAYVTPIDRLGALLARLFPFTFAAAMRTLVRRRGSRPGRG
jgi:short-subunit dehydrogenase